MLLVADFAYRCAALDRNLAHFTGAQSERCVSTLSRNELHAGANLKDAIHTATQRWMGWTIGRQTSRDYGIPRGMPYLTGFVIHAEIVEDSLPA